MGEIPQSCSEVSSARQGPAGLSQPPLKRLRGTRACPNTRASVPWGQHKRRSCSPYTHPRIEPHIAIGLPGPTRIMTIALETATLSRKINQQVSDPTPKLQSKIARLGRKGNCCQVAKRHDAFVAPHFTHVLRPAQELNARMVKQNVESTHSSLRQSPRRAWCCPHGPPPRCHAPRRHMYCRQWLRPHIVTA